MKDTTNNRRAFIKKAVLTGIAGTALPDATFGMLNNKVAINTKRPEVLFFDVNETVLDLGAVKTSITKVLNGRADLVPLWFTTMLQYSLVSTVGNQYFDFGLIGAAALQMIAKNNNITLTNAQSKEAIKPILNLQPHPEVITALIQLKKAGYKMVSFTNSSNKAVAAQLENARLTSLFDAQLSIEDIGKFKPHVDAYNWAARKMDTEPGDCMLVAAHGWDVAGAQWAGWRTAFIARPGQQLFPLAPVPEINIPDFTALAKTLISLE